MGERQSHSSQWPSFSVQINIVHFLFTINLYLLLIYLSKSCIIRKWKPLGLLLLFVFVYALWHLGQDTDHRNMYTIAIVIVGHEDLMGLE